MIVWTTFFGYLAMSFNQDIIPYIAIGMIGFLLAAIGYCSGELAKREASQKKTILRRLEIWFKAASAGLLYFTVVWYPNLYLVWCTIQIAESGTW